MSSTAKAAHQGHEGSAQPKEAVRRILEQAKKDGRDALTAPEGKALCDAYGIVVPGEALAKSADEARARPRRWASRWC